MIGEFGIIERFFTRPAARADVVLGVGDDAAVLDVRGLAAVTVDTLVAGVHFPEGIAPQLLGYRAAAVNLSDLAAMGAEPRWATLALTLPEADEAWLDGFSRGLFELLDRHAVSLVGGNLARGPLSVTLQLMGTVERDAYLTRSGAKIGDEVYVTGSLGDGAAGIASIKERGSAAAGSPEAALQDRYYRPRPRVAEGLALRRLASAAIDVSDGLVADLAHLCQASGCGAVIDVERLPLSTELRAVFPSPRAEALALSGGDDYELCFTAPPERAQEIEAVLAALGTSVRCIGVIVPGAEVVCRRNGAPWSAPSVGYRHF
jgi:thiamine-monophosphate kinase